MSKHTTGSMTPGRVRKISTGLSNTQRAFDDDIDDFEIDENDFDGNFPVIHNAPFHSQQRPSSVHQSNYNKNTNTYYTPQLKRKRIQDQVASSSHDSFTDLLNTFQNTLNEMNRKIDLMNQREVVFEKKFENVEKSLSGLSRKVNKNPTLSEPPRELPVIDHGGRNLFSGPIGPTPAHLMKRLINELFTKEEMMAREHEKTNERTEKIKKAVELYFFQNDDIQVASFWDYEGKVIRQNQRRGTIFRNKIFAEDDA
ncbi:unnamed protein product [Rotaria magnacalcarata]|uniref:Uncharacterized protein n=1 Tax=Rotaria magnacalcarata TaxID=392030 RepID=A0A814X8U6_9BILA|nr:unnamed protein product [Rotaria magnacalcarata]CAF1674988.1 unnamed protein product [Rotaria magnacalcarata]CAF2161151.1 unnamed protein product [Rotaria magnacalcarata]CAF3911068.1 unnamed protein product [Rotaria magnacalcarata]CAF3962040.1 unnamed protein product [Rotaria magnacalcarata]